MEAPLESPAGTSTTGVDPLAAALLPVLLHRMNNTTQLLSGLQALLTCPGEFPAELWDARAGDLGDAQRETDDLGWILAVVASATGSALLLERRKTDGLRSIVDLVRSALRRDGRDLPDGELPDLEPALGEGWELAWALASLLWTAAANSSTPPDWMVRCGDEELELTFAACSPDARAALEDCVQRIRTRIPDLRCEDSGDSWRLGLPVAWCRKPECAP